MPLQPFDLFSNETRLIIHNRCVYKLKLIYKPKSSQIDPSSCRRDEINTELSEVIRAVLFLIKAGKDIPPQIQTLWLRVWASVKFWKIAQKLGFSKNGSRLKCGHVIELAFCLRETRIRDDEDYSEQSSQLSADSTLESDARNESRPHNSRVDLRRFVIQSNASLGSSNEDTTMRQQPEGFRSETDDQTASTGIDSPIKNFSKSCRIPIYPDSSGKCSDQSSIRSQTVHEGEDLTSNNSEEGTASVQVFPTSNRSIDQSTSDRFDSNPQTANLDSYPKSIERSLNQTVCNPENLTSSDSGPDQVHTNVPNYATSNLVSQSMQTIKVEPPDNYQQRITHLNSSLAQINQTKNQINTMNRNKNNNNNNNNNNNVTVHSYPSERIQSFTTVPQTTNVISTVTNTKGYQQLLPAVSSKETLAPEQTVCKFVSSSTQTNFGEIDSDNSSISNLNENIPKREKCPTDLDKSRSTNPHSFPDNQNVFQQDFPGSAAENDSNEIDVGSSSIFYSEPKTELNQTPLIITNANLQNSQHSQIDTNMPTYADSNLNNQSTQMSDTSAKKLLVTDLTSSSLSPNDSIRIAKDNKCNHVIITKYNPELINNIVKSVHKSRIRILNMNRFTGHNKMISLDPKEPTPSVNVNKLLTFPSSSPQTNIQKANSNPSPKNPNPVRNKIYSDNTHIPLTRSFPDRKPVPRHYASSSAQTDFDKMDEYDVISNHIQKNSKVNQKTTDLNRNPNGLKVRNPFPNQEEALYCLPSTSCGGRTNHQKHLFSFDPDLQVAVKQINLTRKQGTVSAGKSLPLTDPHPGLSRGKASPEKVPNNLQHKKINILPKTFQEPKTQNSSLENIIRHQQQNLLGPNSKELERTVPMLPTSSASCSQTNNINEMDFSNDSSEITDSSVENHPYLKQIILGQTCLNSYNPSPDKPRMKITRIASSNFNNQCVQIEKNDISKTVTSTQDLNFSPSSDAKPQNKNKSTGYFKDVGSRSSPAIVYNLRSSKFDVLNRKQPASACGSSSPSPKSTTGRGNENAILNMGYKVKGYQDNRSEAITPDSVYTSGNESNKENPDSHTNNKEMVPKENSSGKEQPFMDHSKSGPSCSSESRMNPTCTENNRIQRFMPDKAYKQILDVRPNSSDRNNSPLPQKSVKVEVLSKNDLLKRNSDEKKNNPTDEPAELSIGMHDRYHVQTQDMQEDLKLQNLARPSGSEAKRKKYLFWGYVDFDNLLPRAKRQK